MTATLAATVELEPQWRFQCKVSTYVGMAFSNYAEVNVVKYPLLTYRWE
jgi:hypothetical protein